ncbi:AfsR/SARP family transcriptional regulator [Pengzhenrongella sicca]|uniref:Bacterial transcriptional activator domain-containing protein n=1 Tax=Pengzhenrongella sicca TaxID=2819238 RepID=A0A8A4ZL06_9MICO|nr:BTAD domain-containing putative transcriptional regulator [Pengzhenrongella sicca]QTE31197.1 hypothetical protein J4E96_09915 [Pengzhenrongella sicca]
MRELRVTMMGSFTLTDGREVMRYPLLHRAQSLLAIILLAPERSLLRESAAESVWPDAGADASKRAMRQALWQIHHATDAGLPESARLVLSDGEALRINPERPVLVDVDVFADAARQLRVVGPDGLTDADVARLARAAELYRGPLLAGCYDEWCLAPRARLDDRALTLLDALSRAAERQGQLDAAIGWAQRLLDVEPAHERTHRRLMRLYHRTGDRTRALRQLHRCRWTLQHELGVDPSALTEELGAAIGADLSPEAVPLERVPPERAPVLPAPTSPGGRVAALEAFRAELAAVRLSIDAIGEQLRDAPA